MPTDVLPIAKFAVQIAAGLGVSKVISDIITNNTNVVTTLDTVKVWTGSLVLGSMIADQSLKHVNQRIDTVIAWHEERKAALATEVAE